VGTRDTDTNCCANSIAHINRNRHANNYRDTYGNTHRNPIGNPDSDNYAVADGAAHPYRDGIGCGNCNTDPHRHGDLDTRRGDGGGHLTAAHINFPAAGDYINCAACADHDSAYLDPANTLATH
jgi:hypothetical protein